MSYSFRETYKQDNDTYVENRGYAYTIRRGDAEFRTVDAQFGNMLQIGQTAVKNADDGFEVIDGFPLLESCKADKQEAVKRLFELARKGGVVASSCGFEIDANDRANTDIDGLIKILTATNESTAAFCDANNMSHEVTLEQLKAMQLEIIRYAEALYARKWQLRSAIEAAMSVDAVNTIVIDFSNI